MLAGEYSTPGYASSNGVTTVGSLIGTKKPIPIAVVNPASTYYAVKTSTGMVDKHPTGTANTGTGKIGNSDGTRETDVSRSGSTSSVFNNISPLLLVGGAVVALWFFKKGRF